MKPVDIEITNPEILRYLDGIKDMFYDYKDNYGIKFNPDYFPQQYSSDYARHSPKQFLEAGYFEYMKNKEDHVGFPEEYMAVPATSLVRANSDWKPFLDEVKEGLVQYTGANKSSLATYYPPGGFVGWHTNWNNPGYQLLFTWSETGDSYFLYLDPETNEFNKINERAGWQGHLVYFGSKEEPENVLWHAAYTNCDRFAWGPTWKVNDGYDSEESKQKYNMIKDLVDELQEN